MQSPSLLKEINHPDAPFHIGGIGNFMQPLCEKLSEDEMEIVGWVSSRGWNPNEKFCFECAELYKNGAAWKFPFQRKSANLMPNK